MGPKAALGVLAGITADELRFAILSDDEMCIRDSPHGGERILIKAVTDRVINSAMLPADAGCVVDNVDTVIAVYEAVILGKPVMDRICLLYTSRCV